MSDSGVALSMRRNAVLFDQLADDCASKGLKVVVALSSDEAPKTGQPEKPAKDLVIRVHTVLTGQNPVTLNETVTGTMREAVASLRNKLALV